MIPLAYRLMKEKNESEKRLEVVVIRHGDNRKAGVSVPEQPK